MPTDDSTAGESLQSKPPLSSVAGGLSLRVLCIDGNHNVADSEAELLRLVGFEVRACYGGREALAEAAVFLPVVCLLYLNMPGMDGDELAMRLRE